MKGTIALIVTVGILLIVSISFFAGRKSIPYKEIDVEECNKVFEQAKEACPKGIRHFICDNRISFECKE